MKYTLSTLTLLLAGSCYGISADSPQDMPFIYPPMVSIQGGEFSLGDDAGPTNVRPRHEVEINDFYMAKYPVTNAEFQLFVNDTGYQTSNNCKDHIDENWLSGPNDEGSANWQTHRYKYSNYQPVTCISAYDALAYAQWLTQKTGTVFRLPTEQEWEYAAKANTKGRYFWGDDERLTQACKYGNFADVSGEFFASEQYGASYKGFLEHTNCDDGEPYNSIVGLYRPNPFGLYDMLGNISEMQNNCYHEGYQPGAEQEPDLSACEKIVLRGSSWHSRPTVVTHRGRFPLKTKKGAPNTGAMVGFRLASDQAASASPAHLSSTMAFEHRLKKEQQIRKIERPEVLKAPEQLFLHTDSNGEKWIYWGSVKDARITGYDLHISDKLNGHQIGQYFKRTFTRLTSVTADTIRYNLTRHFHEQGSQIPASASIRITAHSDSLASLPSSAVSLRAPVTTSLPGTLHIRDALEIENANLAYAPANETRGEQYWLSKPKPGLENPTVTASFSVRVQQAGWYTANYRGRSRINGSFFRLWHGNNLLGEFEYEPGTDDKSSDRHQVYLPEGEFEVQITFQRPGFDYFSFDWVSFKQNDEM